MINAEDFGIDTNCIGCRYNPNTPKDKSEYYMDGSNEMCPGCGTRFIVFSVDEYKRTYYKEGDDADVARTKMKEAIIDAIGERWNNLTNLQAMSLMEYYELNK